MTKRAKSNPGEVFEVEVAGRFGYLQYLGKHPGYGDTVRVCPKLFDSRPELRNDLFDGSYITFYPVGIAIAEDAIRVIGKLDPIALPSKLRRPGAIIGRQIKNWIIEEGFSERLLNELSQEDRLLPIGEIWSHDLLKQSLIKGWRPESVVTSYE